MSRDGFMNQDNVGPSRRAVLTTALGAVGTLAATGCSIVPGSVSSVEDGDFDAPLRIPPQAESTTRDGVTMFTLRAHAATQDFGLGRPTSTWGFNEDHLGPTIRAARGDRIRIEVTNELPETTSVHWHGMHLPAAMDGGPHQSVDPGDTWSPEYTIDQPAATLWYHPHPHGRTEAHVYRGLAGLVILDDDASASADLPRDYGVDDVPLIVADKVFDENGQLVLEHDGAEPGQLGSVVLVNGTVGPYLDVTARLTRLRLLNGSTARTYSFGLPDRALTVIATDGGFLDAPLDVDRLRLVPGERAEVLVEMSAGTSARLRSYPVDLGSVTAPFAMGGNDEFDVLELRAEGELLDSPAPSWPVSSHAEADRLDSSEVTVRRDFMLDERTINGKRMDMSRIDERVALGSTEVWTVRNDMTMPHSFHIHDVQFRVLDIDGERPPAVLRGPKDTVYLEPRRNYRLLMRFTDYADDTFPYMYHCHMLLHEDEGMMGQFLVLDGEAAGEGSGTHRSHPAPHSHS